MGDMCQRLGCVFCYDGYGMALHGGIGARPGSRGKYLALPGKVVFLVTASVQRDEEVCAGVSVGNGKLGVGHLRPCGGCSSVESAFDV